MVTDATAYHTIDSSEFVNCTPKYEGTSEREFVTYLDASFRDEKTILANESNLPNHTVNTLYSLLIMPQLTPLNSTKNVDEHAVLEIVEYPEGYSKTPKAKTAKIFIM